MITFKQTVYLFSPEKKLPNFKDAENTQCHSLENLFVWTGNQTQIYEFWSRLFVLFKKKCMY